VLRAAQSSGQPYHIVHFDGHGVFAESDALIGGVSPLTFGDRRPGKHGYLVFENSRLDSNIELVDGPKLGALLVEAGSPVLVLNACRSAHSEALQTPARVGDESSGDQNPHLDVRAFGSLAQEIMDSGVPGVVAMRYNVYVVTAAQFVADLYTALLQGYTLGEAVSQGRKQLHDRPLREVIYPARLLQDWMVPIVYEAAPLTLLPRIINSSEIRIDIHSTSERSTRDQNDFPPPPDVGFFGRDETILSLDRAFDEHKIVLIHALAGSGKTSVSAEFARWYAFTRGVQTILFTSFENYRPLPIVLDAFGRAFAYALEAEGIQWLALDDTQRREVALQILSQVRVLWVWDNVEPVNGFPPGAASAYTEVEQQELVAFLREAREVGSKFLLTSRRDEYGWFGNLAARVSLPPMPMQERIQLAQAIAKTYGVRLLDIETWQSLLNYTEGNPLTLTVLTRQALHLGLSTKTDLDDFVARLRGGEGEMNDNVAEGRSASLGASLSYGFATAFNRQELAQLALLHFFQGFVDIYTFALMRLPEFGAVKSLAGMTRDSCIALLNRASDIGLLTKKTDRHYTIQPALPWYLKSVFEAEYPEAPTASGATTRFEATRGFVEAMGEVGHYYAAKYDSGSRELIGVLAAEEANLLHAMGLALKNDWWKALTKILLGLNTLYNHTGRKVEWARVINDAVPLFVDPNTQGALLGREEEWSSITGHRVDIAIGARDFNKAESLVMLALRWVRRNTDSIPRESGLSLTRSQEEELAELSKWLNFLGIIKFYKDEADCVQPFLEDYEICMLIGYSSSAAKTALSLGNAYKDLPSIRDLDMAKHWYQRSFDLRDSNDALGRARVLYQFSLVSYQEFLDAQMSGLPQKALSHHLNRSLLTLQRAATLVPPDAVTELANIHHQLGVLYSYTDHADVCFRHFEESIRYEELKGNHFGAAVSQYGIARNFAKLGRLDDALVFAKAALKRFEAANADDAVNDLRQLIEYITLQQRRT
jgi:tetratricopeptide (TPR) repeat protein